jgi:hypothetical protein
MLRAFVSVQFVVLKDEVCYYQGCQISKIAEYILKFTYANL